jgi:sugar lactone lactonase YvrE
VDSKQTNPVRIVAEGFGFPQSPRWRDGRLWFSDLLAGHIHVMDDAGQNVALIDIGDQACGLGWSPHGHLIVATTNGRLLRFNGRRLVEFADLSGITDHHLNDLLVDPTGRAYISCSGFDDQQTTAPRPTRLILVEKNGFAHAVGIDLFYANGMAIAPDGQTLIVAETFAERISAFNIAADGTLNSHRVWATLSGLMPNGLCIDREGAVWVASPMSGEVLRIREGGEILDRISVAANPTACVLGGDGGQTLFVTATKLISTRRRSGRIDAIQVAIGAAEKTDTFRPACGMQ